MWADNETDEDLLGFEIHANLLKSIVVDPAMLPVTVGLFGDWGGGKSSILKILQRDLAPLDPDKPETLVVYFDTWVFQGYEDAKAAILAVLLRELRDHRAFKDKIYDEATGLLARVNWMKAAKVGLAAGVSYLTANPLPVLTALHAKPAKANGKEEADQPAKKEENATGDGDKWLRDVAETAADVKTFRRDFESMLGKTGLKSLIVLIDDIDRCSPEHVIENLEAIKLFLNVKGMAFVIAADRRIVENAIRVRYTDVLSSSNLDQAERNILVSDYLEKLVQVPYTLPKLAPHEVRSYLSLLLLKKVVPGQFNALRVAYSNFIRENRYEPFDLRRHLTLAENDPLRNEVEETFRMVETCCDPITEGLKGNPRQIKRFLNGLWMRLQLARVAKLEGLDRAILIKLMVLEYINADRFRDVYDAHRKSEDGSAQFLEELEDPAKAAGLPDTLKSWQEAQLARWVRTAPPLARVDLRDYFWLSRSSLDHTFAGVQLVSKAVRRCVDDLLSGDLAGRKSGADLHAKLDPRERLQVASALGKIALRDPEKPEALQALFELGSTGGVEAAEVLSRVLTQSDPDRINLRLAQGFGALRLAGGMESVERLVKARAEVIARKGKFGVAVARASTKT
jgi:KAP family P-loop domain